MKKIILALLAISVFIFSSCEREDFSAFVGSSMTDDVTNISSDSFEFHGVFTLEGGVATSSAIGVFMDVKPGVNSGQYAQTTSPVKMINGATYFTYTFSNIDSNNERIFEAGTTIYYRAYLRVTDTDRDTHTYVYGEEKSFTVPLSECTLMVYGAGGGNLDYSNAKKLLAPMMKEGRNGNLQVTFQYKPSAIYQGSGEWSSYNDLQGAQRWVMPSEGKFRDIWNEHIEDSQDEIEYTLYAYNRFAIFSEMVGDENYDMANPQNLATFINWSMEKCPAKHYILLLKNHGGGWDLYDDGAIHVSTKAQLYDDNLKDNMSLIDFIVGVQSSEVGFLDGVIFDEHMMATMENITATSQISKTLLASQETTYSLNGASVMNKLKNGISDSKSVFNIFSDIANDYVNSYSNKYTDFGAYDLTKIETLLLPISEASTFLQNKYNNSAEWKEVINGGINKTLWSYYTTESGNNREKILEVKADMANWASLSDVDKDAVITKIEVINQNGHFEYCLYDLLAQTIKCAEEFLPSSQEPEFSNELTVLRGILTQYDTALRNMAFINCGTKVSDDTPYLYTSPSVCLQSLNENVYGPITKTNLYGYAKASQLQLEDAKATYNVLHFDQVTNWSGFLQKTLTSGTPFYSDDRQYRQAGQ